jgi:hypothetical protein
MTNPVRDEEADAQPSCTPGMNRKEFLAEVVKKASLVGALAAAPLMVDAFLVPSAEANPSAVTDCSIDPATGPSQGDTFPICSPNSA